MKIDYLSGLQLLYRAIPDITTALSGSQTLALVSSSGDARAVVPSAPDAARLAFIELNPDFISQVLDVVNGKGSVFMFPVPGGVEPFPIPGIAMLTNPPLAITAGPTPPNPLV
jgi:hypothetical protein